LQLEASYFNACLLNIDTAINHPCNISLPPHPPNHTNHASIIQGYVMPLPSWPIATKESAMIPYGVAVFLAFTIWMKI